MICLSVSRSPHASARPSSVASISTRRACATSLKHSSPCPPRPTASPPPTSPLGCAFSEQGPLPYAPRHAAYDLKNLRGKQIVQRIARTRRYHTLPAGLRAMAALLVLRNKAIKPLLAAARPLRPTGGAHNPRHRYPLPCRTGCHARPLPRARPCRLNIDNFFAGLRP